MKSIADHPIALGLLFLVPGCSLWAQAPAATSGKSTHSNSAPTIVSVPAPSAGPSDGKPNDNSYVIGNDDRLRIDIWNEPNASQSVPVRSDGKISLPLVKEVQAAGRTPLQLEQEIATQLLKYMTKPEVTVIVEQINSQKFNILGQVAKPGSYPLTTTTTVLDAIATAGSFRDFAKQKGIYVLRNAPDGAQLRIPFNYKDVIKGKNPEQNIKLQPNDTIVVP